MKSKLILFILAFLIWVMITWPLDFQHLIVGILVAAVVSMFTGDLFVQRPHFFTHFERYIWFLWYVFVFIWECFKANVDVAYRVIHPKCPLKPGIVKVKTSLKSDTALTFLANSITLTPGTLTVDIDREKGILYIHWIYIRTRGIEETTRRIVYRFEKILRKIFE